MSGLFRGLGGGVEIGVKSKLSSRYRAKAAF